MRNNSRWEVLLPHYLYCNIVYITIIASNILKYIEIQQNWQELNDKRFKSTWKMITFIFLIWLKFSFLFTWYKLHMHKEYKGFTFIYSIYKCWPMSIFNVSTQSLTQITQKGDWRHLTRGPQRSSSISAVLILCEAGAFKNANSDDWPDGCLKVTSGRKQEEGG